VLCVGASVWFFWLGRREPLAVTPKGDDASDAAETPAG
jgi:hypothetical protein